MNDQIEQILRNPAVLKKAEGDGYTDDTASKWAWCAHGYDTGMEPFYSIDQLREAVRAALPAASLPVGESQEAKLRAALTAVEAKAHEHGGPLAGWISDTVRAALSSAPEAPQQQESAK